MAGGDLFTGTLDILILKTLSWGPMHGYAIGRWIRETTSDVLRVEEGALYPALHRLDQRVLGRRVGVVPRGGQRGQGQVVLDQQLDQVGLAQALGGGRGGVVEVDQPGAPDVVGADGGRCGECWSERLLNRLFRP